MTDKLIGTKSWGNLTKEKISKLGFKGWIRACQLTMIEKEILGKRSCKVMVRCFVIFRKASPVSCGNEGKHRG